MQTKRKTKWLKKKWKLANRKNGKKMKKTTDEFIKRERKNERTNMNEKQGGKRKKEKYAWKQKNENAQIKWSDEKTWSRLRKRTAVRNEVQQKEKCNKKKSVNVRINEWMIDKKKSNQIACNQISPQKKKVIFARHAKRY